VELHLLLPYFPQRPLPPIKGSFQNPWRRNRPAGVAAAAAAFAAAAATEGSLVSRELLQLRTRDGRQVQKDFFHWKFGFF